MTHILFQECIGCEMASCEGCMVIDLEVNKALGTSRIDIIGQNGSDGLHYEEISGGSTPTQYGLPTGAKDLQDLIEYRSMGFSQANIFKAMYRYGTKNDNAYELNKVIWFANRMLDEEKAK